MYQQLLDLAQQVTDEKSFVRFLTALREDCEQNSNNRCEENIRRCDPERDWETRSTAKYLRSVEEWAANGDFADGQHYGEPILRRVATMLLVGRHLRSEDRVYGPF